MNTWIWLPQADITLWELAMALNVLLPVTAGAATPEYVDNLISKLPPDVARHFTQAP
jgi:hypothetical protein